MKKYLREIESVHGRTAVGLLSFALLAGCALWLVINQERDSNHADWSTFLLAVGRGVEPLWVASGMFVYTVVEGVTMIAEPFLKWREERGRQKGLEEGREEGREEALTKILSLLSSDERRRVERELGLIKSTTGENK